MLRAIAEARAQDKWWDFRRSFAHNAVTDTGPNVVARALHAYRATRHAERGASSDGSGGNHGSHGGGGSVVGLEYDTFVQEWGEHHGSCSWCPSHLKVARKVTEVPRCFDIADLVPADKLRIPFGSLPDFDAADFDPSPTPAASVLWLAAMNGLEGAVKALLSAGAMDHPDGGDADAAAGLSAALSAAAARGHARVVERLLAAGARPDVACSPKSRRPLHIAATHGHAAAVEALLAAGADPSFEASPGDSAQAAALRFGHTDVAALLSWTRIG